MTKYRIQLDLTDDELNVLCKTLLVSSEFASTVNEALGRTVFRKDEADHLLRIIEEINDAGDLAEPIG